MCTATDHRDTLRPSAGAVTRDGLARAAALAALLGSGGALHATRFAAPLLSLGLAAAGAVGAQPFRQTYALETAKVRENAQRVAADLKAAPPAWQGAPAVYYAVAPLSDIRRLPDTYPADGAALGTLEIMAAQGEFEPGSFVVYPRADVDRFTLRAGDLRGKGGVIPAAAVDIKLVKLWYQAGSGWCGEFNDPLGRLLVPEMLLNDEDLVRVDPETRDNYVRYSIGDGQADYRWMSAMFSVVNYSRDNQANQSLINDAATLQPCVLNKDEFKQFLVTVKVPGDAKAGVYTGAIAMAAEGREFGAVPLSVTVLPFGLPRAMTNYDPGKEFIFAPYLGYRNEYDDGTMKDLADHNALYPINIISMSLFAPDAFEAYVARMKQAGLGTDLFIRPGFYANVSIDEANPGEADLRAIDRQRRQFLRYAEMCRKALGHTRLYAYGRDEAPPEIIRTEQSSWLAAHEAGIGVFVASKAWRRQLFALDFINLPGIPSPLRKIEADKFHESNPHALVGWYADPHCGPENPDYFRRAHGLVAYKANYDVSANYILWRNNWNDNAITDENWYRGIVTVLGGNGAFIHTLAYEGMREGLDDVRYATRLKQLAAPALEHADAKVRHLARRALSWLAYADERRESADSIRMECIAFILDLQDAAKGGAR